MRRLRLVFLSVWMVLAVLNTGWASLCAPVRADACHKCCCEARSDAPMPKGCAHRCEIRPSQTPDGALLTLPCSTRPDCLTVGILPESSTHHVVIAISPTLIARNAFPILPEVTHRGDSRAPPRS